MTAKVFISYRRDDSAGHAGRIHDRLEREFGRDLLFMDTDAIPLGQNFAKAIDEQVSKCDVLLAVIGPGWLDSSDQDGNRRLTNPNDFVRIEIATALKRGIPVIPILIEDTRIPAAQRLPDDLRELPLRNGLNVHHVSFHNDIDRLIRALKTKPRPLSKTTPIPPQKTTQTLSPSIPPRVKRHFELKASDPAGANPLYMIGRGQAEWFKDDDHAPEMVVVPPGEFVMGSDEGDTEKPAHKVIMAQPFAVGRFAVTFDEWDVVEFAYRPNDQGWGRGHRPVINVSWEDAKAYVSWLSQRTSKLYRLLSESEWEYCCRAGATTQYASGDTIRQDQAQFFGQRTVEVGTFAPNSWGLYDMHGNIWEWCEDAWNPNYNGAPRDGSPRKVGEEHFRVRRGGSWVSDAPRFLRSAMREGSRYNLRDNHIGFRVARDL